jgi:hypothetical protein
MCWVAENSKVAYPGWDMCGPEYDKYCPKPFCCSFYGYCNISEGRRVEGFIIRCQTDNSR